MNLRNDLFCPKQATRGQGLRATIRLQRLCYSLDVFDWLTKIFEEHSPPEMCFKIVSDASIQDSLGDEIKIFKNEDETPVGVALNANELSNEVCFNDVKESDNFKFVTAGDNNVS